MFQPAPSELAILKTVVYFDLFDYPLTLLELYQNLPQEVGELAELDLVKIGATLRESEFLKQKLQSRNGFYFLSGRQDIVETRQARYRCFLKKIRRAKRLVFFLRFIPFIRGVAICNSLSFANARPESDIDFFILTKPGALWSARGWAILLAEIFGHRPAPGKTKDAYCLSFFAAANADLNNLRLRPQDVYFDWWMANLLPIYDKDNAFEKFFANNQWLKNCRPKAVLKQAAGRMGSNYFSPFSNSGRGARVGLMEKFWHKVQMRRLPSALKKIVNTSSSVVIDDQVLKFHWPDKREEYSTRFGQRLQEISSAN